MKKPITLFSFLFFYTCLIAQDSTHWKISFDAEASGLHLFSFTGSKEIRMDQYIYKRRRSLNPIRPTTIVSDNPNFHTATYAGLKIKTSFRKKYTLETSIYAEDRGASYGANDLDNIVLFPIFTFEFQDTFQLINQQFEVDFKFGNFQKHKIDNGLKIYNIDVQAVDFLITHKKLFFNYNQIGDLSFGIGLALEEYYNVALGYKNKRFKISVSGEWNSMDSSNSYSSYQAFNLSGNYYLKNNNEIFFQIGQRYFAGFDFVNNGAILLGANLSIIQNKTFTWSIFPKVRFYKENYNAGHLNPEIIYRKPNRPLYSNTVGRYLYPLRNYYYDFDQWAIFTEYQNFDILGLGLKSNMDWNIFKKFHIKPLVETLSILRDQEFYTNIFYEIDFCYEPINGLQIGIKMTNKTYNLDAHFQTFYMMQKPIAGLHIKLKNLNRKGNLSF